MSKAVWKKLNGTIIKNDILEEIELVIQREHALGYELSFCIGTDSQVKGKKIEVATVIVIVRKGKGAFMYINTESMKKKMSIKERMMMEVGRSIEVAYELHETIQAHDIPFEIHLDINTNPLFKSHEALKDALGYVMGMGFSFKAKPYAFASTCCANKIVQ